MTKAAANNGRRQHPLGLLHRYGGITAALLVIVVCLTGILLNHTDELGLADTAVGSATMLDWYGIEAPETQSYASRELHLTLAGQRLYLNAQQLEGNYAQLQGFVRSDDYLVASTGENLLILQPDGRIVETLSPLHGIPAGIQRIGMLDSRIAVATATGVWQADTQLTQWQPMTLPVTDVQWAQSAALPAQLLTAIHKAYRGEGLPLERVILDLHSGRILGRAGPLIGDAVAILFTMLALSGIWLWFKSRRRQKHNAAGSGS